MRKFIQESKMFVAIIAIFLIASIVIASQGFVGWGMGFGLVALSIVQNISFTLVSRARNRDNNDYHAIASVFSNGIYFLVFKQLYDADFALPVLAFYVLGTITGSVVGVKISMFIEKMLGASADAHLTKK